MTTTRGVVHIHSAPSALCPHIEWAVGGVLGVATNMHWTPQPAQSGTYRAELSWSGSAGSAAGIASALRGWNHLRFEVTEEPTPATEGARYSYTPDLGVFHAVTGLHGDLMIPEDRIKAAVVKATLGDTTLLTEIDKLLGKPWDDELETFRHAGEGAAHRGLVADVGLHDLDLADVAHQAHGVGQMRLADGHANAQALLGEGPNDLGSDEA